ncbi:MAG: apolipoprotein N-acyltransferase [Rickettsiaceae bacterium]|nr:MAG: apolipoprotein N-acyltransferase [Rickettsiaceae bacterium]
MHHPFPKKYIILLGMLSGLAFAPLFFVFFLFTTSILCHRVKSASNPIEAFNLGLSFGFGHFLTSMYWISIGVGVYINEFWWVIPFALFGLPLILSFFIAGSCLISWLARKEYYFHFIFCLNWVLFEWLRSWIFTGLPWNLLGYAFCFSDTLMQSVGIFGIYGLSFIVIYISSSYYDLFKFSVNKRAIARYAVCSLVIVSILSIYGYLKLKAHHTLFSNISVRLVQPSILQTSKWNEYEFWHNLETHIKLSNVSKTFPDLVIWSEAALVVPYKHLAIRDKITAMLENSRSILVTGSIADNNENGKDFKIFSALQAISSNGNLLFEYHKSHLVPFGEYVPLSNILPMKKLTPGYLDYTEGTKEIVYLKELGLKIKPLICYESIFPELVRTSYGMADIIINVTNDAWYGKSSGPHQHLHISRIRAIENGLPLIRAANNGISAIIDPMGRIIKKLDTDEFGVIDSFLPIKIEHENTYQKLGDFSVLIAIFLILFLQIFLRWLMDQKIKLNRVY